MAVADEGELKRRRAVRKRAREKQRSQYLEQHRERLEKLAQHCVNRVLYDKPKDPYAALLGRFSEHTEAGVRLAQFRACPGLDDASIQCEVVASARGQTLAVHSAKLPKALVARGLAAASIGDEEVELAAQLDQAEAAGAPLVASQLCSALRGAIRGLDILSWDKIHESLCSIQPASAGDSPVAAVAARARLALRSSLAGILLDAVGRLLGGSAADAAQATFQRAELPVAVPPQCQQDLELWQYLWPQLLLPGLQGATRRRRLLVGVTVWAATLPKAAEGGELVLVDEAAHLSRQAAECEGEVDDDEPEPDEFCPPLNAMTLAAKLGAEVAGKTAAEGETFPAGEDFAAALGLFRKALEGILPDYAESESLQASTGAVGRDGTKSRRSSVSSSVAETEHATPAPETLADRQRRGCIYCVLDADAGPAFDTESGTYCFAEGAEGKSAEQLADHYVELCAAEPLLRGLLRPFAPQDPASRQALARLRQVLPPAVVVLEDSSNVQAQEGRVVEDASDEAVLAAALGEPSEEGEADVSAEEGLGFVWEVDADPVGLMLRYQSGAREIAPDAHRIYDFGLVPELLPALPWFVGVSLSLPEKSRRLLLPKTGGAEELEAALQPVGAVLRGIQQSAYRRGRPVGGLDKSRKILDVTRFREGLRKFGAKAASAHAEAIFGMLDFTRNGSLSVKELQAIEHISGPASLEQVDEFRAWLSEWQLARQRRNNTKGQPATSEDSLSPFAGLVERMDAGGAVSATFANLKKALRKMRHPAAIADEEGPLHAIFLCVDRKSCGVVKAQDMLDLGIFSATHQLHRVVRVRDYLQERFGSAKAAFKALDAGRQGLVSGEEWAKAMEEYKYPDLEDLKACFYFIDKEGSRSFASRDFEALGRFDPEVFFEDLRALRAQLLERHGDMEQVFSFFEQYASKAKLAEEGEETTVAPSVEPKSFLAACRASGVRTNHDPRLLFHFLDAAHLGRLQVTELSLLERLGACEDLEQTSQHLQEALASIKEFAMLRYSSEGAEEAAEEKEQASIWAALHKELLEATELL